jgi:integrase
VPKIRLTDLTVQSLKAGLYFDEKTPAFGIRVGKRRKTWLITKGQNRTKVTIGHYPALSLADARRKAQIAVGSPLEPRTAPSFPDALDAFLKQDRWKARSKREIERTLRRHFDWSRPVNKITYEDVAQSLEKITAKSERAHALKDIKTFFSWCVPRYLPHSPCVGLKADRYKPRERVLTDQELGKVWNAADGLGVYGKQVQTLITTGQRVAQIIAYDQSWTDGKVIVFPGWVMKSGREHRIPIGKLTATLLPHLRKSTYPGKRKIELDNTSGVIDWTLHDLRRTFSTNLAQLKVPQHITERLLDHLPKEISGVAAIYNRYTYMDEMREAIRLWESKLQRLIRSSPRVR